MKLWMRRGAKFLPGIGLGMVCILIISASAQSKPDSAGKKGDAMPSDYTIASYYFPNYHPNDPRNIKKHGGPWSEWELVKNAKPRFEGHHQPNVPLWGYVDESDPAVMAKKIDAAADHGIDVFIFDWYYYDDGPFLQKGLEEGFLKAPNNNRIKFATMWANHDWIDIHPATLAKEPELVYPGTVTPETFDKITDHIINVYFKHPSHWMIDGKPYFSIYELHTFIKSFGSLDAARAALDRFREKTIAAGFPGLHLNAVAAGIQILPSETAVKNPEELIAKMGFDSVDSYVWVHHVGFPKFPQTSYDYMMEKAIAHWSTALKQFGVPYHPNVTMGWDPSPRCLQTDAFENKGYPFMATMGGNTPEKFKQALTHVKAFLDAHPESQRTFTINCWNEWTEGSYLEPDTEHGMAYLEAVKAVFP